MQGQINHFECGALRPPALALQKHNWLARVFREMFQIACSHQIKTTENDLMFYSEVVSFWKRKGSVIQIFAKSGGIFPFLKSITYIRKQVFKPKSLKWWYLIHCADVRTN